MKTFIYSALLTCLLVAHASHASNYDTAYYSAYSHYQAAADGESRATRRAVEQFTTLHAAQPNDPVAMVQA